MAAPVVAGTAAVLRSFFPSLKAEQIKKIILDSAKPLNIDVNKPGTNETVKFSDLSVTGGILNMYEAVKLALNTKGQKKVDKNKVNRV